MRRCALLFGLIVALAAAHSAAACADCLAPPPASLVEGQAAVDQAGRAIAAVYVNDQGPFRFVVDTGANRSVLSSALAQRLGVRTFGMGVVHSVTDMHMAPLTRVRSLRFGEVALVDAEMPVLDGPMLAGEQGMLGFDTMAGRRLQMDFVRHCVEIVDANTAPALDRWRVIHGHLAFGSMMVAMGEIQGVRVHVLIDTGSDISLCNPAFKQAMNRVAAHVIEYRNERAFTAGRPIILPDAVWSPRIYVGHVPVSNVVAYVGAFHIFDLWHLTDEPTVLIGMDVIAPSEGMAIDYERNLIYFRQAPHARW